jgi:hypothetical protein
MSPAFLLAFLWFQVTLIAPNPGPGSTDLLPQQFAGWQAGEVHKFSQANLGEMAGPDAAVLREYGIWAAERKQFSQGSRQITVEALRMQDSSAAYGAFTFYRREDWRAEAAGAFHYASGDGQTVVLRNSFCLRVLGAELDLSQLQALVAALPTHDQEILPQIREFLPERGALRPSLKYVLGPVAAQRMIPQVPAAWLAFDQGAEVQTATYRLPGQPQMTLLLAMYPTPQVAALVSKTLAEHQPPLFFHRTGPLISIVVGAPSPGDAGVLLNGVKYQMDVVWNQAVPRKPPPTVNDVVRMVLAIMKLAGILLCFCAASGILFGAIRVLGHRYFPDSLFDRDVEIIRLHLTD